MCLNGRYQFSLCVLGFVFLHLDLHASVAFTSVVIKIIFVNELVLLLQLLELPKQVGNKERCYHIKDSIALALTSRSLYAAHCSQESGLQHLGSAEQYVAGHRKILRLNHLSGFSPQINANGTGTEHMDEVTCTGSQASDREAAGVKNMQNCIWRST